MGMGNEEQKQQQQQQPNGAENVYFVVGSPSPASSGAVPQHYYPPQPAPSWGQQLPVQQQQQQQGFPPQALGSNQNVMYIYAPQGSYAVPGNPSLFAVPNGQPVYTTPGQQAMMTPAVMPGFFQQPQFVAPISALAKKVHKQAVACLVLYIVGMVTFLPHVASVALSLHMVRYGYINKKKAIVIAFSILELIAYAFVLSFSWYFNSDCYSYYVYTGYNYNNGYSTGYYSYYCSTMWWGWISLVVWFPFGIAFGIPRVLYTWRHDEQATL